MYFKQTLQSRKEKKERNEGGKKKGKKKTKKFKAQVLEAFTRYVVRKGKNKQFTDTFYDHFYWTHA